MRRLLAVSLFYCDIMEGSELHVVLELEHNVFI